MLTWRHGIWAVVGGCDSVCKMSHAVIHTNQNICNVRVLMFQSRTRAFSHFWKIMSPCPHVPMISIPLHPSFRSHSLKMNAHFVVGIDANLRAARQIVYNPQIYSQPPHTFHECSGNSARPRHFLQVVIGRWKSWRHADMTTWNLGGRRWVWFCV